MKKSIPSFVVGLLCGMTLFGGSVAYAAGVMAEPTWQPIFVDGQQVSMTAYNIGGNNYVKLRDIGQMVGFNVYWKDGVQVDSGAAYTGVAPEETTKTVDLDALRQEMIWLVNEVRRENGVKELVVNQSLMDAAQDCSSRLFTSHKNRVECETVAEHGYPHGFGSNLTVFTGVASASIPQKAVSNWKDSVGHFQTMIDPSYESIGIGITINSGRVYCYMFAGDSNAYNPYA